MQKEGDQFTTYLIHDSNVPQETWTTILQLSFCNSRRPSQALLQVVNLLIVADQSVVVPILGFY